MKDYFIGIDPARRSPWWRRLLARLFGRRVEGRDGTAIVVGYQYKGVLYITRVEE